MAVDVDICASALIKLNADPFDDFSDDTKEARLCRYQYTKIRDAVLRSAPWNFAVKRVLLTPIDPAPSVEWEDGENFFQLPAECVRVWKVDGCNVKYRQEGRRLVSADSELRAKIVVNNVNPADYDAEFMEAVANALAADLCYALTQSNSLKESLLNTAKFWIDQARSHNSQEGTPEDFQFDDFLAARFGGPDAIY